MLHLNEKKTRKFRGDKMTKKITLACAICASRNYTTSKNVSTKVSRMEVRKYCKTCGQHTLHRETK
jgi:large subunit ribosomal protein L33